MTITMDRPRTSGNDRIRSSDYLLGTPATTEDAEALERDRARRLVQRVAGQHAAELVDMLGLVPSEEPLEPTGKACSTCKKWKLFSEFYRRPTASDGLYSQCKICNNTSKTWKVGPSDGRGTPCAKQAVAERQKRWQELRIDQGMQTRAAARKMRIGERTARRYDDVLRNRGLLPPARTAGRAVA